MSPPQFAQFVKFLEIDLAIPAASLDLALRQSAATIDLLPMTLFQYGLISLDQLARIFDWMETI
jgi:hypothetical protein